MEKDNNKKILEAGYQLADLTDHINLLELYLDGVAVSKRSEKYVSHYFMEVGLDMVYQNITDINTQIKEISNRLIDIHDMEEGEK